MTFVSPFRRWSLMASVGLLAGHSAALAQSNRAAPGAAANWQDTPAARVASVAAGWDRQLSAYRPLTLDLTALRQQVAAAPLENTVQRGPAMVLTLPMPDGATQRFRIAEAPVMEPGLAAQYPTFKTYAGIGLDDPTATLRCDVTVQGFHAQVLSRTNGTVYIDPVSHYDQANYIVYYKHDIQPTAFAGRAACGFQGSSGTSGTGAPGAGSSGGAGPVAQRVTTSSGGTLRTVRTAVAATAEYTAFQGGTVSAGQAAIVTAVNRVTGVYEKEVAVRLLLVANNSSLVYTNSSTDPYTNSNASSLLTQNQTTCDAVIGSANYDIGHVFSTGGGGLAQLGVVCVNGSKAKGETGSGSPVGDGFYIDYVAHEIGHQFGGNHTFNSSTSSCGGGNRNASTAMEPGSGSTIQAYAGICGSDDLQPNSDAYFHYISYQEIQALVASKSCYTSAATGNTAPSVSVPADKSIPASTPFSLTATASDAEGDALTYCWEDVDLGASVSLTAAQAAGAAYPLFRSFSPVTNPTRYFPRLSTLITNTVNNADKLPTVARTLKFRCTVRDQHMSAPLSLVVGGVNNSSLVTLTVVNTGAAFAVTAPNTAVSLSGNTTVTWNVAGTSAAPISCATVNIKLSTDGGLTYPTTLLAGAANSGSATVTLPNLTTSTARIMVAAADNYFFDISNANFSITPGAATTPTVTGFSPASGPVGTSVALTGTNFTGATSVTFNGTAASFTVGSATSITATVPAGATSGTIAVTKPSGTATSTTSFTVIQAPTITSFSPTSGPVGTSVTVTGTNLTGVMNATFNGTATTSITANTATSVTVTVPAGATTGLLTLTTPGGTATSSTSFTVLFPPTITSFAPASGPVGTSVVVTGTDFTGATNVTFNGTAATSFTVNSATQITATVPGGATTGVISVTSPGGTATSATSFTVVPAPAIASFSPTSGPVGTSVTITGTDFTGATSVTFNGTAASFTVGSATSVTATVPAGATSGTIAVTTPGGTATSATSFTVVPAPTITSFSPASGPVGTSVTITGTNLTGATSVTFNGTAASFTVGSATSVTATVPAGATTGLIAITTLGGTATSATNFTVVTGLPPKVTSFTPASGVVGATVTVTGTNFTGATAVLFNGAAASTFTVNSATSITVTVPGAATTGKISVTTPAGTALSTAIFKVLPTITSFTPAQGAPGTLVTVTGTGLTDATLVKFAMVTASFTVVNPTTITFTVPATAVTGKFTITTPGGIATSATVFTIAPTITSFTPGQGAPGSVVLLEGYNFTSTTTVSFNGVNAVRAVNSGTLITATVPAAATTGPITIANATGSASTATAFTVVPGPAPTVTSFTPTTNVVVGTVITITGTNLTGATAVRFNATTTSAVTVLSATQVQAAVPAGASSGFVYVVTPKGMAKSAASLTIIQPPTISSFSPASGSPGAVVLIAGYNFVSVSSVTFNGVAAASYTVNSATQIAAYVPAGATTGKLGVTTIAGSALSATNFTVTSAPAPTISALSPGSGPRGSAVVVSGTNFTGVSSVKIGVSTVAVGAYTVDSPTQITLTVPSTAVTGTVYVTTAGGMAQSASAFTVILPPTISSFTPASGAVGTLVTVNGSNFTGATSVTFGATATASFTLVSAARITVNVPAGATTGTIKVTNAAGTATSAGTFTVTGPRPAAAGIGSGAPLELAVYPNPASTFVGIQVTNLPADATSVTLLDAVGRVVRTADLTEGYNRVPLAGLTPGMYVVRVAGQLQRLVVE